MADLMIFFSLVEGLMILYGLWQVGMVCQRLCFCQRKKAKERRKVTALVVVLNYIRNNATFTTFLYRWTATYVGGEPPEEQRQR